MNPSVPYRRILISRMKYIGDIVLTTPIIRAVRAACPDAYIAYLGEKDSVSLLLNFPGLDEIIGFDFARPTVAESARVVRLLRKRDFDLVLDLFSNPRTALLSFLSGARVRVGLERKGRGQLYTIRVPGDGAVRTAVEFHQQFIRAAGIPPVPGPTEIVLTESEKQDAAEFLRGCLKGNARHPLVGIHPGATWPAKRWLPERFAALADALTTDLGAQVIVTSGPHDTGAVESVVAAAAHPPTVLPVVGLRKLAAVISLCDVFVSNDAGPMHIAAAVGTPTIGLFGPGQEEIWFPYDSADGHIALRKDVPCHPCHLDFCNRSGDGFMECMKLLAVSDVVMAIQKALRLRHPLGFH